MNPFNLFVCLQTGARSLLPREYRTAICEAKREMGSASSKCGAPNISAARRSRGCSQENDADTEISQGRVTATSLGPKDTRLMEIQVKEGPNPAKATVSRETLSKSGTSGAHAFTIN
mgnify:CR=1 FL=1